MMIGKLIDEEYLDYVRAMPCQILLCREQRSEADHLIAVAWKQSKRNDWTALNLCTRHHGERHQIGDEKFEAKYRIDLWKEAHFILIRYFMDRRQGEY